MKIKGLKDTIKWYDKNANKYTTRNERNTNPEQIKEFISLLPSNSKVLDAGCGGGRDSQLLHDAGVDVTGLDLSSGLIKEAKKRHPELNFINASFLDIPYDDQSFDGIWAHASLVHLETLDDVKKTFSEFNRILVQGGILHILVKAQTGENKTAIVSDKISGHNRFFQYFSQDELLCLLKDSGFEIIKIEQYNETDKDPELRPEVEWIHTLSKKVNKKQG